MRIVIALGGNALLKRGEPQTLEVQRENARRAARSIASLAEGNELIITHGNGPQIGLLALQTASGSATAPYPLDVLGAETDGMIGYLLEQELINALGECRVATLLTQTEVDRNDAAFQHPTKFIGPVYDAVDSRRLIAARRWTIAQDGQHWRRVVPSPEPKDILEVRAVEHLIAAGFVTICAGGGGIPVARSSTGEYSGVECVVDKDLTSALLASKIEADYLLMLTDVPAVYCDFGTPRAREIRSARPEDLDPFTFPAGSMGPKVEAARRFARKPSRRACIGSLDNVPNIIRGRAGTTIATTAEGITYAVAGPA
jgi:carbamate kinase